MSAYLLLTGKELARKRVLLVTLLITLVFLVFYCFGLYKIAETMNSGEPSLVERYTMAVSMLALGLFFAQMVTAFFVFFASIGAISGEIDNGQLFAVLSRPIARWKVFVGKWMGFGVWNLLYGALLFWSIVLANHFFLGFPIGNSSIWKAFLLFEWIPLVLGAIALLGSCYLPLLGNGVLCTLVYGMSLFAGLLESVMKVPAKNQAIENFSIFTSLLMPSDALFRRMIYELAGGPSLPILSELSQQMSPFTPASLPNNLYLCYTFAFMAGILAWGCVRLTKRDIA